MLWTSALAFINGHEHLPERVTGSIGAEHGMRTNCCYCGYYYYQWAQRMEEGSVSYTKSPALHLPYRKVWPLGSGLWKDVVVDRCCGQRVWCTSALCHLPSPGADLPTPDLCPDAASGADVQLVAWGWAPACSPNPELLFVTNCFVCSVGDT